MNRRAKPVLIALLALFASAGFTRPGLAAPSSKRSAEVHYDKGMKAYTLGHFTEAIEEFEKAYEFRSEPIFLYNIAQSHRQNHNPKRAIFFYRRYLAEDPEAKNRIEVDKRIKDMESQLDAKAEPAASAPIANATGPQPAPSPPDAQPAPAPALAAIPPANVAQAQAEPTPATSSGAGLRVAGIGIGALGVAAVVSGVFLGLHANQLFEQATEANHSYDYSKDQSSKTYRTMEWIALGVGGAAILTGGVLYFLGASKRGNPPVAIAPLIAPGTGGAALFARF